MRSFCVALCLLGAALSASAVSLDPETGRALEEAVHTDRLAVSVRHVRPRRRPRAGVETLLAVDFPGAHHKTVLQLDRANKRVVLETTENGRLKSHHIPVESLTEESTVGSLVLSVEQSRPQPRVAVYVDCELRGEVLTPRTLRDVYLTMRHPRLQVYREKRYTVEVDSDATIEKVLTHNNCPGSSQMQAIEPASSTNDIIRGDIPIIHDCDDNMLVKAINELVQVVKQLRAELDAQKVETHKLRQLLEECDICQPGEG